LGLKSLICDISPVQPVLADSASLEKAFSLYSPSAILLTHINGMQSKCYALRKSAMDHNIPIIDDRAQSLNSERSFQCLHSTAQIYSTGITKILSAGLGGFVQTNSSDLAQRLRYVRTHGLDSPEKRTTQIMLGHNSRFSDLHATLANNHLSNIDKRLRHTRQIFLRYSHYLSDIENISSAGPWSGSEYPIYSEFFTDKRDDLISYLDSCGIQSSRLYQSLHTLKRNIHDFVIYDNQNNSEKYDLAGISLPSGPTLSLKKQNYVIDAILRFFGHSQRLV
jgi:dTDP-4-amino-4,6-dideoxygalactose transaminase